MSKITALVVEDNPVWQRRIRRWLENYDCDVTVASDYQEAKNRLDAKAYDMVTLDMVLSPDEEGDTVSASSGWELLVNRLARDFPGTAIFVVSSSFGNEPERAFELNQALGVKGFMNKDKNFEPMTLKRWVEQVQGFKKAGGRPDVSAQELIDIYNSQPDVTTQELLDLYKQQLAIHRKNKLQAELQQAQYGIDAPPVIGNRIRYHEEAIKRIEAEIANLSQ